MQNGYPYGFALLNLLFIGLALGAVLDSIDQTLRPQLTGSAALLLTGGAQWVYTRRAGHPVWSTISENDDLQNSQRHPLGTWRGRLTTLSVIGDAALAPLMFVAA